MEEYLGFTFNNIHSFSLGIVRTIKQGSLIWPLLPQTNDIIAEIAAEGTLFFGSKYAGQNFLIDFAFGPISEQQLNNIKNFCESKKMAPLIFDESPYQYYCAKITSNSIASYYTFEDNSNERVYYGKGQLNFTSYFPYAIGRFKFIEEVLTDEQMWRWAKLINMPQEWPESFFAVEQSTLIKLEQIVGDIEEEETIFTLEDLGGLLTVSDFSQSFNEELITLQGFKFLQSLNFPSREDYGVETEGEESFLNIVNMGNIDMPFSFVISCLETFSFAIDGMIQWTVQVSEPTKIRIDSRKGMIVDYNTGFVSTKARLVEGELCGIPTGEHRISIVINGKKMWNTSITNIEYNYLYL